jgi:hypothetical protein
MAEITHLEAAAAPPRERTSRLSVRILADGFDVIIAVYAASLLLTTSPMASTSGSSARAIRPSRS